MKNAFIPLGGLYAVFASAMLSAMRHVPDPTPVAYELKPRQFEQVNRPTREPAANGAPTDVRDHFRAATARKTPSGGSAPPTELNDVQMMLQENFARANAAGLNQVTLPQKRRSRRTRDFCLMFVPVNAFLAWWAFGPAANPASLAYGIGGMAAFSAGLTWVMFFVMDDY